MACLCKVACVLCVARGVGVLHVFVMRVVCVLRVAYLTCCVCVVVMRWRWCVWPVLCE